MALPKRIRVNVKVPFPALVEGSGFIVVTKASGVWTISHDYTKLAAFIGTVIPANIEFAVRDLGTGGYALVTLADLVAAPVTSGPRTVTASTDTAGATDASLIFNNAGGVTETLPAPSSNSGRWLYLRTIANGAVISASSNVVPLAGGAAGTAILAATAGKWAHLQSDGTNWQIMAAN